MSSAAERFDQAAWLHLISESALACGDISEATVALLAAQMCEGAALWQRLADQGEDLELP